MLEIKAKKKKSSDILNILKVTEQKKWNKQWPDYHTFIIDGGLVVPEDTGEGKFISIQIESNAVMKFLLLEVFGLFSFYFQTALLLDCPEVISDKKDKEKVKLFWNIGLRLQRNF